MSYIFSHTRFDISSTEDIILLIIAILILVAVITYFAVRIKKMKKIKAGLEEELAAIVAKHAPESTGNAAAVEQNAPNMPVDSSF